MSEERSSIGARWLVPASFGVALAFRLIGLGGSSMWLDEILETLMARGSMRELFSALLHDKVHPPLEPLVSWLLLTLGQGELARRIASAVFGAAAIALFGRFVARRFGVATAALSTLFLASSPILVRYAHELRPYALALLLSVWALDAADRWIEKGAARFPLELVAAAGLASITHYLAVVLWVPIAAAYLEARLEGTVDTPFAWPKLAALALSVLPLALWFALLAAWGGPHQPSPVADWNWVLIERRFGDLMLRGYVWQPAPELSLLLFAILTAMGLAWVARRRGGLTVLAGVVAGTGLIEVALVVAQRFSHVRYNLFGLLFLHTAIAAGIVAFARSVARWNRLSGVTTGGLLAAAVVAASVTGLIGYAQHGRPDWPAVARAVTRLEGAQVRVITTIPWAQFSIGYYLGRMSKWGSEAEGVPVIYNDRGRLREELGRGGDCHLVLVAGHPRVPHLLDGLRPKRPVLQHLETDQAELFRFAAEGIARQDCFPPPDFRVEPSPGYGELIPWL